MNTVRQFLLLRPLPSCGGPVGSLCFRPNPKESPSCPTTTTLVVSKEEEVTMQVVPLPIDPSEDITGPSGTSPLLMALHWGPPIPCHIPQLALPARSFKQVKLKGSGKMYICEWCKNHISNQDSMMSHCLQEHPGVHLVCPKWGDELFGFLKVPSPWQGDQ